MARLSLESSRHMAPPYNGPLGDTDDWQRLLLRKLRKLIGLPASSDVGALANQITKLIDLVATDPAIDFQVKRATISVTHLVALYQDDLQDACEYAKIEYLEIPYLFRPLLWETSPVFASYGLGLCEHFRYFNRCSSELENMTEWNLLTVDYSKKALTTSFTPMKNPFGLWEPDYRHTENFDLGFDELEKGSFSSAEIYWGLVGEEMHIIPERFPKDLPSLIVLTGDAANVTRFRKILESTFLPNKPVIYGDDIIFAAAKGTAEMYFRKVIWETIRRNQTTDAKTEMKEMEL
jgi:hypothetical protein